MSDMALGAEHDFTVFQRQLPTYLLFLQKEEGDRPNLDPSNFARSWAIMADKGYTGADRHCNAVLPWRTNRRGEQFNQALLRSRNQNISRNRIICENFYGRLKSVFAIAGEKYRGSLSEYTLFHDLAVALTNFHITLHPLRQTDIEMHRRILSDTTVRLLIITYRHSPIFGMVAIKRPWLYRISKLEIM